MRSARSQGRPPPASGRSARRGRPGGRSARARSEPRQTADPGVTSTIWLGSAGSCEAWVVVITVWPSPATDAARTVAAARVELGENVVEQQQRRRREQRRLGQEQREHPEPLLALRAEPAQVAAGRDREVVEVRPEPRRSALDVRIEARLERGHRCRLALVDERAAREAELLEAIAESRLEQRLPSRGAPPRGGRRAKRRVPSRGRARHEATARAARGGARRFAGRARPRTPAVARRAAGTAGRAPGRGRRAARRGRPLRPRGGRA